MSYSLTIDKKTYYFDLESVRDEAERKIKNETSNAKKQEILENQYLNKKKCATSEDGLVELNESDEVEETHMSERVKEEETPEYKIKQNDFESYYNKYISDIGIASCGQDLDKWFYDAYSKFNTRVCQMMIKISELDANDPEQIDAIMKEFNSTVLACRQFENVAGLTSSASDYTLAGSSAGLAAGFVGCAVLSEMGVALSTTGVGIVLGVCAFAGAALLNGFAQQKQQEAFEYEYNAFKNCVQRTSNLIDMSADMLDEKIDDKTSSLADEVNKDLDGLLGVSFKFDDIKDTNGILNNMDKLINAQKKLMPYAQLGAKYGFDTSNINTLINKLGTEEEPTKQADSYIRGYANAVTQKITFDKNLVSDTESYNKFHTNIKAVIDDAADKGVNVEPLETALQIMENANQNAENDTAASIVSPYNIGAGYSGDYKGAELYDCTKDLLNSSDNAKSTSDGVRKGSTSYSTSVDDLDNVSSSLLGEAQNVVDGYADTVENAGMDTVEDWNDVMLEGQDRLDELAEVQDKVSSAKVQNAVEDIPEKQQEIIAAEVEEFLGAASGTNDGTEVAGILSQVDEKIETYGSINVDTSKLDSALETIISNQQEFVDSYAQGVTGSGAETVEDWNNVMLEAIEMLENQSPLEGRVDLSSLDSAIADVPNKQQEIISGEVDEFVSRAAGTNDGGEVAGILSQVDEKIETYGSINVDTSKLDSALETIISNQQEFVDSYAQGVTGSGAETVEDWNNIMLNAIEMLENQSPLEGRVDLSILDSAIADIPNKQQEIISGEVDEFVTRASGTNDGGEVAGILSQVDEKIKAYESINVNTTGLDSAKETIISNQEEYLEKEASESLSSIDSIEDINECESIIQNLNSLISDNSSFVNVSSLDSAIAKIQAKMDEITQSQNIENQDENPDYTEENKQTNEDENTPVDTPLDTVLDIISENKGISLVQEDETYENTDVTDEYINNETEIAENNQENSENENSKALSINSKGETVAKADEDTAIKNTEKITDEEKQNVSEISSVKTEENTTNAEISPDDKILSFEQTQTDAENKETISTAAEVLTNENKEIASSATEVSSNENDFIPDDNIISDLFSEKDDAISSVDDASEEVVEETKNEFSGEIDETFSPDDTIIANQFNKGSDDEQAEDIVEENSTFAQTSEITETYNSDSEEERLKEVFEK